MYNEIPELRLKISTNLTELLEVKETLKQKDIEHQDVMKDYFRKVIEVIDAYENKESSLLDKNADNVECIKVITSFSVIKRKLLSLLATYGVTQLDFQENKLIVGFCKVVGHEPEPSKRNDEIISIVRNGYIRGHESIRDAEVIIVKN